MPCDSCPPGRCICDDGPYYGDYESCPSDPAELLQDLKDRHLLLLDMQEELDSLQNLKDALRTARPSASVWVLRRVTRILQVLQAGSGITPDLVEHFKKRFEDDVREAGVSF